MTSRSKHAGPPLSMRWRIVCLAALALLFSASGWAQVVVVVGVKHPAVSLTQQEASNLFLGKSSQLGDAEVVLLDLPESDPVRAQFYDAVTGKSLAQAKAIWSRLTFTGKATPPQLLPDARAVKKALAADPRAIGYIDKKDVDSSVKVLLTAP